MDLEKMTVKQLRKRAVNLGMPKEDAGVFDKKAPLIATINSLKASSVGKEVKRVKTLNPAESPKEKREVEKKWKSKADRMRAKLESQPKIRFMVPLSGDEKPGVIREEIINGRKEFVHVSGAIETVQLNGYKTLIPKGVFVELPEQVAEVLSEAHRLTQEAGKDYLIDRVDPETGKKVGEFLS